jgi:hypothetical protein
VREIVLAASESLSLSLTEELCAPSCVRPTLSSAADAERETETQRVSVLEAISLLLQNTSYQSFDKLHAVIYQESPVIIETLLKIAREMEREKESSTNGESDNVLLMQTIKLREVLLAMTER